MLTKNRITELPAATRIPASIQLRAYWCAESQLRLWCLELVAEVGCDAGVDLGEKFVDDVLHAEKIAKWCN